MRSFSVRRMRDIRTPSTHLPSVEFDPDCEAMIFTTDGTPLQGITGGWGGDRRVEFILPPEARKARKYDFVVESSCNGMFGVPWNGDTIEHPDVCLFPLTLRIPK